MTYEISGDKIIITSAYHNAILLIKDINNADAEAQEYISQNSKTLDELKIESEERLRAQALKALIESQPNYITAKAALDAANTESDVLSITLA